MKAIPVALSAFLLVAFFATASMAQVQRTFVSGFGSDANPCTRIAPCRTFGQAISLTNPGGEVIVLDSAGYGAFAIIQAVSIVAPPGIYAGISVFSGNGIDISVGDSDTVILRGLTINNQGSTLGGILYSSGGTLHVESCVVSGFSSGAGLFSNGPGNLEIKDSIMRGDANGIFVQPLSGTATASIEKVRLESCSTGLGAGSGSTVTVRGSIASGNETGFSAASVDSRPAELNLEKCVASNNSMDGISALSGSTGVATVRLSNSTVTNNSRGLSNGGSPAVLLSRGNNTVEGNVTNTNGTIGSYSSK